MESDCGSGKGEKVNKVLLRNILLINPPGLSLGYNVGLCYLAANLKKHGFEVKILDFLNQPGEEEKRLLQAEGYDVIGISIKTLGLAKAAEIMKKVKAINSRALLIAGGVHVSLDEYNFMKECPFIDVGFMNDAEQSLLEFMQGKSLQSIEGIVYRRGKNILTNPRRKAGLNLDELPYPDFDSFDIPLGKIGNYPLLTSRGCPYNCIYCTVQLVNKKWVPRTVNNLIKELKHVRSRTREFQIVDDNFTLRIDRVKEFCRRLIIEKINLRWSCPNGIRADIMDEELVRLMKKSGCYLVNLGIESLDEQVFNHIQKGEKLEAITRAIHMLKKEGIIVIGNFIIGLPGSTFKLDMSSVKKAKKLGLDVALWYPLSVYPKTEVYNEYMRDKNIRFIADWKDGFHYNFNNRPKLSFEKKNYTQKEMIKMFFIANLKSKSYGILLDPKKSLWRRGLDLVVIILRYDPLLLPYHIWNAFNILLRFRKVY